MRVPDRSHKDARFLSLTNNIKLPSNLLAEGQARLMARTAVAGTAEPYRYSATLDLATTNCHAFTADRSERRERQQPSRTAQDATKKWIIEKEHHEKQQSLAKRLKNMRVENDVLESFSLSKLLSKIKVLKDSEQRNEQLPMFVSTRKSRQKKAVKPRVFKFRKLADNEGGLRQAAQSLQISPRRYGEFEDSSKIFKRYYCPPSSYRDPAFFREISPEDKYIYRDGKKVECKRIHNFYTSHMYKRGYSRHYRKLEGEDELEEGCYTPLAVTHRTIK